MEPGQFLITGGGSQPDSRSKELTGTKVVSKKFKVSGIKKELKY